MSAFRARRIETAVFTAGLLTLVCAVLGLSACSGGAAKRMDLAVHGGRAQPVESPGPQGPGWLPAPSTLLPLNPGSAARRAEYVENDLQLGGLDYDENLPLQNYFEDGSSGAIVLTAEEGLSSPLAGLAYCCFKFIAPGYDRSGQVRLDWQSEPEFPAKTWIALANWGQDRWDFYPGSADGRIFTPGLAPYFNASSELLCLVLLGGAQSSYLEGIRLGGIPPNAQFSVSSVAGQSGLEIDFDAHNSTPGEGAIASFEWDFEGDGVFELDNNTQPLVSHTYSEEGIFTPTLRVTNSEGEFKLSSREIRVIDFWQHSFGTSETDSLTDTAQAADGSIYACGYFENGALPGTDSAVLLKLSPFGELLWSRAYSTAVNCLFQHVAIDASGAIVTGGQTYPAIGNSDMLLCKWSSAGELLWDRSYAASPDSFDSFRGLAVSEDMIYGCGSTDALDDSDYIFLHTDGDGDDAVVTLTGILDGPADVFEDYAEDMTLRSSALGVAGVSIIGRSIQEGVGTNILRVDFDETGNLEEVRLGDAFDDNNLSGWAIDYYRNPFAGIERFYIGGTVKIGGVTNYFVAAMPDSGTAYFGRRSAMDGFASFSSIEATAGGEILASGFGSGPGPNWGYLGSFGFEDAICSGQEKLLAASAVRIQNATRFNGGYLLCGHSLGLSGAWTAEPALSQSFSLNFYTPANYKDIDSDPDIDFELGNVNDLTGTFEADLEGGGNDMYIEYRSAF